MRCLYVVRVKDWLKDKSTCAQTLLDSAVILPPVCAPGSDPGLSFWTLFLHCALQTDLLILDFAQTVLSPSLAKQSAGESITFATSFKTLLEFKSILLEKDNACLYTYLHHLCYQQRIHISIKVVYTIIKMGITKRDSGQGENPQIIV